MYPIICATLLVAVTASGSGAIPDHHSQLLTTQYDVPGVNVVETGFGKAAVEITAGATGAPLGFTVRWIAESDYLANGGQFYRGTTALQGEAVFTGVPTVNAWGATDFLLDPFETVTVEIGDLLDETGVVTNWNDELTPGTRYVFTASANGDRRYARSDPAVDRTDQTQPAATCAFTRGQWERNPGAWPVGSLLLGNQSYGASQLFDILSQGSSSNGLVHLSRQLIAAKLNIANGADGSSVQSAIFAADATIGFLTVPPVGGDNLPPVLVRDLAEQLDDFNNGIGIGDPCRPTSVESATWGALKAGYR